MALETVFHDLEEQCRRLYDSLRELRVMIVEDKPEHGDVVLVDTLGDAVEDLLGWLAEMRSVAAHGRRAVAYPLDAARARQALVSCHERFQYVAERFFSDLVSYEQIAELLSSGHERDGEWEAWAGGVKDTLENCRQPIASINQALLCCWQEMAERLGSASMSVHATNIGQQISAPEGTHDPT